MQKVNNQIIKQVSSFNCFGTLVTEDARCVKEIKRQIVQVKSAFTKLYNILRTYILSIKTRVCIVNCCVYVVLMYESEVWSITSEMRNHLKSCEMWFLR